MPRTVSMRTREPESFARSRARCTSIVFEENVSTSLVHTCCAIWRRSATAGENRISISRMLSSVEVSAGRQPPNVTSREAGSHSRSPITSRGGSR